MRDPSLPTTGHRDRSSAVPGVSPNTKQTDMKPVLPRPKPTSFRHKLLTAATSLSTSQTPQLDLGTFALTPSILRHISPLTPPASNGQGPSAHNQFITAIAEQLLSYQPSRNTTPGKRSRGAKSRFQPVLSIRSRTTTPTPSNISSVARYESQPVSDRHSAGLFVSRATTPNDATASVMKTTEQAETSQKSRQARRKPSERELKNLLADSVHNVRVFGQPLINNTRARKRPERYIHSAGANTGIDRREPESAVNTPQAQRQPPWANSRTLPATRRPKRTASSMLDPADVPGASADQNRLQSNVGQAKRAKVSASSSTSVTGTPIVPTPTTSFNGTDQEHAPAVGEHQEQAVSYDTSSPTPLSRPTVQTATALNRTITTNPVEPAEGPQDSATSTEKTNQTQPPTPLPGNPLMYGNERSTLPMHTQKNNPPPATPNLVNDLSGGTVVQYRDGSGRLVFSMKVARGYDWQNANGYVDITRELPSGNPGRFFLDPVARIMPLPSGAPFSIDRVPTIDASQAQNWSPRRRASTPSQNLNHIPPFVPPVPPPVSPPAPSMVRNRKDKASRKNVDVEKKKDCGDEDDEGSLYEE